MGLDTRRMRGEPIGPQHREGLIALLGDPRVGATLGGVATPAMVDAHIERMTRHRAEHGFGWYAFADRESGALVARGGPLSTQVDGRAAVEVGWTVVHNVASRRVMEKLGFTYAGETEHAGLPHVLYRLSAASARSTSSSSL